MYSLENRRIRKETAFSYLTGGDGEERVRLLSELQSKNTEFNRQKIQQGWPNTGTHLPERL